MAHRAAPPPYSAGTTATRSVVLVVSIDGLAPRHVTRATMPALTTLALEGASCFAARTVTPPTTLPVHTSMLRGVAPSTHGLYSNTPAPLRTDAPSFLQAARDAGRSTAIFINWLPLDAVIEREAAGQRFVVDGGYDPDEDRRCVDAAVAAVEGGCCDVVFVYLVRPDLAGHAYGWDSAEYAAAVTRSDRELARLLDAVGPEASVLVTTDHGGLGTGHADEVPDVMETFVVVRAPGRISAGSGWPVASPLDVAPTVAGLCGFGPDPRWEGSSLLGRELPLVEVVLDLLAAMAQETYGERVTMLDHALQSAALAASDGAGDEMVLACLLHDLGHVLDRAGQWGLPGHAEVGARALQPVLSPAIVEPIRGHVTAKRYRVAVEPDYHDRLSLASRMSLTQQGGPLAAGDAEAFAAGAFAADAVRLRGYDDRGKVDGFAVPALETYRGLITAALAPERPIDPSWARDACRCASCRDPGNDQHLIDASVLDGWTVVRTDRTGDELTVTLHHRSGERHVCRIPTAEPGDLSAEPWVPAFAEQLRAGSTSWTGDHGPFVDQLARWGIALLHDCGVEPGTVLEVGNTIGFVRETNYGSLFDVVAEPDPVNLAFTPLALPAHTDNPYREPCPTAQLLHCLAAANGGGASRFVDGFAAAALLRAEDPTAFETLTTTDVTFRYRSAGVDLQARRPLIELDCDGAVRAVSVNNRSMESLGADRAETATFYGAYRVLVDLLERDDIGIEIALRPGELVAFDNRRVLHGRRAFRVTERRHLQGCYIDMDAIRSAARLM
ncbi:MAG: HD domain-containing protein [Acidimicrobiaceae bacterium]|nr:HD domain-containing protein [Acidimicrobiaceae bacterium]MYB87310.1 HD domain-containing protein [Acidimicrobiaceae bacterium]MYI37374.1 HD domain-containing protein [Acidimicrobiaceae bacterium]